MMQCKTKNKNTFENESRVGSYHIMPNTQQSNTLIQQSLSLSLYSALCFQSLRLLQPDRIFVLHFDQNISREYTTCILPSLILDFHLLGDNFFGIAGIMFEDRNRRHVKGGVGRID